MKRDGGESEEREREVYVERKDEKISKKCLKIQSRTSHQPVYICLVPTLEGRMRHVVPESMTADRALAEDPLFESSNESSYNIWLPFKERSSNPKIKETLT
jgi:hypothetical protein